MNEGAEKILYFIVGGLIIVALAIVFLFPERSIEQEPTSTTITSITLSNTNITLATGDSYQLTYKTFPTNVTTTVTFESSNPNIASVDGNGNIKALKEGSTTITVTTENDKKAECKVTVKSNKVAVTKITLNKEEISIETGKTYQLSATISPSNATSKAVSWSSDNAGVATVDSKGLVKGVSAGNATITAKTGNGKVAICNVEVKETTLPVDEPTGEPPKPTTPTEPTTPTVPTKPTVPTTADGICESVKNNSSIDYKSFVSLRKNKDDYYVIKAAHDCANKYKKPVSVTKAEYNIYKKNTDAIEVKTDTNFNGATIYIHDEITDLEKYEGAIYHISHEKSCDTLSVASFNGSYTSLAPVTGSYFIRIESKSAERVFQRNHKDGTQSSAKIDVFTVINGKISQPMYWSYNGEKLKVTRCEIPSKQLVFQNGIFETIAKKNCDNCASLFARNIRVTRSNTKIYNLKHYFIDKKGNSVKELNHSYTGFIGITNTANVLIQKCIVYPLIHRLSDGDTGSNYDLSFSYSVNLTLDNVKLATSDQLTNSEYWGVIGSNGCKDVLVKNSTLNRVDAHKGIYNLTVKDTTLGSHGITATGTGINKDNKMVIENVTWKGTKNLISLRKDYGLTWNGAITIKNSRVEQVPSSSTVVNIINITDSYIKSDINFAKFKQPIYNPTSIKIDGLKISSSNVSSIRIFGASKAKFDEYYFKVFKNKYNSETKITKKNITGNGSNKISTYAG